MIITLGENDVKSLDDFAGLATDELIEIAGENALTEREAETLIMKARESWFAEEDAAAAEEDKSEGGETPAEAVIEAGEEKKEAAGNA